MDPNHWNTYNLQYGHSSSGSLPSAHPSLNRLDLTSGLGLSHTLQTTHGSLGRQVSAIPTVSYPALAMPILDPLTTGITGSQGHKTMSLTPGQLVFESQVRGTEQQSPTLGRYDSSKSFRADTMSRNQLLEVAAARVLSTGNFPSSSLYNQFGPLLSDITAPAQTMSPSAGGGSSLAVSKSNQSQMHEPPPAHSSSSARLSTIQRNPHSSDILYARNTESLISSNFSPLYGSVTLGKQSLGSSQQQALSRQTPVHIQQGFSSSSDLIEDLSSNSQNQLYGSYAALAVAESQDFAAAHLSGDISYEAVSPAPPMNDAHNNPEHSSFSIVHFPELVNLTPEHAHTLADKFQENDFRLKVDSRAQQHQHEGLASPHHSQRLEMGSALKMPKDMSSFHSAMLSMQTSQRSGGQFQSGLAVSQAMSPSLSQIQTATVNINHPAPLIQASPGSLTSMQQALAPLPIQAPADSTTKPKRSRSRKKKENNTSPVTSLANEIIKKSSPTQVFNSPTQQQMSTHHSPILNLPPTSHQQHISTLPMSSQVSHSRSVQQQQQSYRSAASNQFTSRDAQRAQTPSMPQSYSVQDHQNHGYAQAQSPKVSHQSLIQPEFILPSNMPNEKSSAAQASYKQQKKPGQPVQKSSNSPLFRSNIPDSQPHIQSFSSHTSLLGSSGQQRGSPMQDNRAGGMSRMQNFDHSPQQKMGSQMSPIGQPSPQGSIGADGSGYNVSKVSNSNHMIGSVMIGTPVSVSQSQMDSRPVSVEPNSMPHPYEQAHSGSMIDAQDSGQFQIDFSGQPFLEQLVGVPPPMAMPSASFGHSSVENGEVVFTTLVTPAENARLQQQQQHESNSTDGFRPTYHGEAVHEIRPIGQIGGHLSMEDVSFNAFFDNQRDMEQAMSMGVHPQSIPEPEKMTLTFMPHVTEDSELCHFTQMPCTVFVIKKEPNEPGAKLAPKGSFQDSFLSYLQGHKQETLSSVSSSAVTKKPLLPKYIPEPRRPKPTASHSKESLNFSDTEDSTGIMSSRVRDLISSLSDNENSSQKSESDREGYSVQRTSELAVKITLPKSKKNKFGPFADMTLLKDSMRRNKEGMLKRKRKKGKHRLSEGEDFMPGQMSDEEEEAAQGDMQSREPTPPPMRMSIGRKAKDKCIEKTKRHGGSGSSSDEAPVLPAKRRSSFKGTDSDKDYDSDKDPVWMPIDMDLKPGHDFDEKKKKPKRQRARAPSVKPPRTMVVHKGSSTIATLSGSFAAPGLGSHRPAQAAVSTGDISTATSATSAGGGSMFKVGTYVIEKKDMHNYETYPVWRLEPENMMKKFEIRLEGGVTRHHAVETFSTWMPSMESQFAVVKVREIPGKGEQAAIEVLDECRPKPPSDGRLEQQYENDPLVETFNVYLQVFLSLALEPTFLSAILQTNEKFYVEALNQIDGLIEAKCREITGLAQWKYSFQENLHRCPLMKEIDRPNLKQPCQASENSSPPTIKSVLLSGHPYDRCLLTEQPTLGSDVAQEFMIGKVAAQYVRPYHSLYHFKYWLRQRCDAKVKMMKESNKAENLDGEIILDKCLENRSWVLQLFDNLKSLLKYGGETPR